MAEVILNSAPFVLSFVEVPSTGSCLSFSLGGGIWSFQCLHFRRKLGENPLGLSTNAILNHDILVLQK